MITSLYASLIAIALIILSIRVIAARGNPTFKFFTFKSDNEFTLERVIRGHSNLIEYAPIFLILLYFFEIAEFKLFYVHVFGLIFLIGRLMHGYCFAFTNKNMFLRVGGTVLTLGCILTLAIILVINFFDFS